jgi:hypothetical protein
MTSGARCRPSPLLRPQSYGVPGCPNVFPGTRCHRSPFLRPLSYGVRRMVRSIGCAMSSEPILTATIRQLVTALGRWCKPERCARRTPTRGDARTMPYSDSTSTPESSTSTPESCARRTCVTLQVRLRAVPAALRRRRSHHALRPETASPRPRDRYSDGVLQSRP